MEVDYSILTLPVSFNGVILVVLTLAGVIAGYYVIMNNINTIILFLGDRGIGSNSVAYLNADSDREYEREERRRANRG
ncbi:hypothetical protein ABWL39_19970 [Chitinivorax sp. PXF-14]|uniref:hypothetical protein n=1 Tax=Chitinivorax sp. PXF-14 TaxID=3230488 RepID=UPI00346617C3